MQIAQQSLMHLNSNNSFKSYYKYNCGFFLFLILGTALSIASWIFFLVALYELKIYGGAKKLLTNYFISLGIYWLMIIVCVVTIFFYIIENLSSYRFDELLLRLVFISSLITFLTAFLSYKFIKNFYYELARVSKQKYFIYAFWTFLLGFCTIFFFRSRSFSKRNK